MVVDTTKSCNLSILCDIPLVRGDCVDTPLMRGDCGSCVVIPLSEEVIVDLWLCAYPSIVRLILCGLVPCLLCWGCICLREELCTPSCIYPNPQWRFPVWEVLCGRYCRNPSVWRRGRRAVAQTSKHISVFVIDPLSLNSLSFISCIDSYFSYLICLVLFVCLTCVEPRELYIAPQLLFKRNLEEIVQSPSPGIRLRSLVTLIVL